jgi:hypothetical protein
MPVQKRQVDAPVLVPPPEVHTVRPVVQLAVEDDAAVLSVRHRYVPTAGLLVEISL